MIESLKKNNPLRRKDTSPEESLLLRGLVFGAMFVALVALVRVRWSLVGPVSLAAAGIGAGHYYSYRRRHQPHQLFRLAMFIAIHLALGWMFAGFAMGSAVPQAQFAVLAQAITSFDLRYRSSLFNTLLNSLAILYIAASLSRTVELGLYVGLFLLLVLSAFFVAEREDGLHRATLHPRSTSASGPDSARWSGGWQQIILFGVGLTGLVSLMTIVVFLFMPRFANRPLVPPFSLNVPLRGGIQAEIINPGVPLVQINGWSDGVSDYFYGFDTDLDLRYRGGLSNAVVMYVRSPSRSYWRSHSYDFYTGTGWQQSHKTLRDIPSYSNIRFELSQPLGAAIGASTGAAPPEQQIVQTYTIVRNQPNLLFAAYRPAEIYIVTENLAIDGGDGLRLPEILQAGMTYSVVSYRPDFDPAQLRTAPTSYPPQIRDRYLQLPGNISERVRRLARELTAAQDNPFDQISALSDHLSANYPYNFFPPPHPEGAEVVDTFLFRDQEGICEQYVTALVVMARTLGIPARLATGYGSGRYNQITGYYEVRANDAHSWAEVYFPEYGWVPFDPTPGWTPQPYPTPIQTWFLSRYGARLPNLKLPLAMLAKSRFADLSTLMPILLVLIGLGSGAGILFWLYRRLRMPGIDHPRYTRLAGDPGRRTIVILYRRGVRLLHRRKVPLRRPGETLAEYAARVEEWPAFDDLTRATEYALYDPIPPDPPLIAAARMALTALRQAIRLSSLSGKRPSPDTPDRGKSK